VAKGNLTLERFVADATFADRLVTSPFVRDWLEDLGKAAVPEVQRRAPERLGHLKRDIVFLVEVDARRGLVLRVVARDFKSGWYEFGTARTPARPYLRPGVAAALPGAKWQGAA
jgi:hypothetical protein